MTKTFLGAVALAVAALAAPSFATTHKEAPAMADSAHAKACAMQADEKKLAGAAKTSFVKKCVTDMHGPDAGAMCDKQADEKKLAGAARTSFVKKCTTDAAAPKA